MFDLTVVLATVKSSNFHVTVTSADMAAIYEAHRRHAESVTDLADQPWGERAFHAVLLGYRFLTAAGG